MPRIPAALIAILATLGPCRADESRPVFCRLVTFACQPPPPAMCVLSEKGGELPCQANDMQLSPPVKCPATRDQIHIVSTNEHKPLATATIAHTVTRAILILVPGAKGAAEPYRALVIEDSENNFPDGGAFVANFYNKDVRMLIGEKTTLLHAGGESSFPRPAKRDPFNMAPVVFQFQQDGEWRTANESMLRFLKGIRYLMISYVDPASGRPRIATIQDIAPVVAPVRPASHGSSP